MKRQLNITDIVPFATNNENMAVYGNFAIVRNVANTKEQITLFGGIPIPFEQWSTVPVEGDGTRCTKQVSLPAVSDTRTKTINTLNNTR